MTPYPPTHRRAGAKLAFGILLILGGLAMVLQNLGLLHQDIWVLFWPGALLLFGFMGLVARGPLHFWGHVMLFFGVVMLMNNLGYEWVPERWWPVGLVWGGLVLVLRSLLKPALPACQDASRGSHD